jgi:hypothetical protein
VPALSSAPAPANLIIGVLVSDRSLMDSVRDALEAQFGRIDDQSELIAFDFTRYYEPEMGPDLQRIWFSFGELRPPESLADDKLKASQLEANWRAPDGRRRVNLDPGYLTMHNLVLATTKNYAHRVYLGRGIHAELTLLYEHGEFSPLKWTYPDYQSRAAQVFLSRVRDRLVIKLRPATSE